MRPTVFRSPVLDSIRPYKHVVQPLYFGFTALTNFQLIKCHNYSLCALYNSSFILCILFLTSAGRMYFVHEFIIRCLFFLFCEQKDSWSLSLAINSGDSPLDLFTEHSEVFLFDGSEKSHSPRIATPRAGKNKGRGKGGKTGKYHRPTSKAVGIWSNTQAEVSDETVSEDALLKVEMVEEDGGREEGNTLLPSSVEISDQQDESMLVVKMSTEESDCPKEQALVSDCPKEQALGDILSDEKLKAMTKVRLGRLELEAVLSKPITHHAFGAEQEQDTEPAEENVYSKPQTARRRKRKRSDFSYALEPAPDLTKTDLTNEEKLKLEGQDCSSEESAAPILLPSEPAGVTQGAKRKDSHEDDDETLVVTMKKLKNEFENQKTVVEQVKDEVYLIGSSSEELSTANSSEETAVSHEGCKKKNYKKKFSQEDRTQSKVKWICLLRFVSFLLPQVYESLNKNLKKWYIP